MHGKLKKTADIGTKSPTAFTAASLDGMLNNTLVLIIVDKPYTSLGVMRLKYLMVLVLLK